MTSVRTIRQCLQVVRGWPGFTAEVLQNLKEALKNDSPVLNNLGVEAIRYVRECGLTVVAVVCDCLGANVAMAKLLGCRAHESAFDDLKTHFPNPVDAQQDLSLVFDAWHCLKLLRNLLGDKGALLSSTYGVNTKFAY
ncbi:hypothetical protein HPB48_005718 [Haemaphysalis longicornis]|uniref:Uncharacterized protein n=1 Tax=Haemaphysalis longicornis TaxID=44386 RepID=A0A9J6FB78_HAELO|nr:hypothetical protein HPB48_005718 [Haemaphysalis longicornis]